MTQGIWRAVLALLLTSSPVFGSGLYFGENGAKALMQGGAFAGQADDLTAIQHNPAGLARQRGKSFLLDVDFIRHDVSFLRKDPNGVLFTGTNEVQNAPGPFFLPNLGVGYGTRLLDRAFTVAFGLYGPPSVGRYVFPEPSYERDAADKYTASPRKWAPQRYSLIENNSILLFPSLSAAYEVHPKFSIGLSVQYVYSSFMFRQAVYSDVYEPTLQKDEDPRYDSIVKVDLHGAPTVTGILGVMVRPTDRFSIGASFRPPVPITARGKFEITLGEMATTLDTVVTGDQARLDLTLPLEAKLGVYFQPTKAIGLNADLVYQGWNSVQQILLTPEVSTQRIGAPEPEAVPAVSIEKQWRATLSGRLGGSYRVGDLTVRAGAMYEQAAARDEYTNIDFAHFERFFFTAGVGYELKGFELLLGGAWTPSIEKEISQSAVRAANTDQATLGPVVGMGTYKAGGWIASLGLRGSFGADSR